MIKRVLLVGISILLIAGLVYYSNPRAVLESLMGIEPIYLIGFLTVPLLSISFRVLKLKLIMDKVKRIQFSRLFLIHFSATVISFFTPARLGEASKVLFLKKYEDVPVSQSTQAIIWERVVDIFVVMLLSGIFILVFSVSKNLMILSIFGMLLVVTILFVAAFGLYNKRAGAFLFGIVRKIPKLDKYLTQEFIDSFYSSSRLGWKTFIVCSAITLLEWTMDGLVFYLAYLSLGHSFSPLFIISLPAFASLIGLISFLPGGFGPMEGTFAISVASQGIPIEVATSGVLLGRLFTIGYTTLLGAVGFFYLVSQKRKA